MVPKEELPAKISGQELEEILDALSDEDRLDLLREIITARSESASISVRFSGPIPLPEHFKAYGEVLPDAPDRILALAEQEQKIRNEGQAEMFANERLKVNRATLVWIGMLVVAGIATWKGYTQIAVPLGLTGIAAIIIQLIEKLVERFLGRDE